MRVKKSGLKWGSEKAPEHRDFEILRKIPINEFGVHFRPIVEGPGGREGSQKVALEHGSAHAKYHPDRGLVDRFRGQIRFCSGAKFCSCHFSPNCLV